MRIDGGCHCGHIAFTAEIDPDRVVACHCSDCQTLSGSAFRTVAFAVPGTFALVSGALAEYVKTTADSGTPRTQTFCPNCGTPIYAGPVAGAEGAVGIRVGAIRQRDRLVPKAEVWTRSRLAWAAPVADARQVADQRL